jgi:hypothetical protein
VVQYFFASPEYCFLSAAMHGNQDGALFFFLAYCSPYRHHILSHRDMARRFSVGRFVYLFVSHFKVESVQKSKDFIVVSGFAESPGFKPLVFDPGDS